MSEEIHESMIGHLVKGKENQRAGEEEMSIANIRWDFWIFGLMQQWGRGGA